MREPTTSEAAHDYRAMRDEGRAANLSGWTVLLLHGPDTRAFLQGLATQDLEATRRGEAAPTFFLNEKGRPVALAWVEIGAEGTRAWVIADEGARSTLRTHLERFRIMEEVEVSGPDEMPLVIGFAGPKKDSLLQEAASSLSGPESAPSTSPQAIQAEPLSFLLVRPGTEASKLRASVASRLADPAANRDPRRRRRCRLCHEHGARAEHGPGARDGVSLDRCAPRR